MAYLYNVEDGSFLGEITEAQLQYLIDQLEEEFLEDRDYAITSLTLEYFATSNVDPALLALLKGALGNKEEITIVWKRTKS